MNKIKILATPQYFSSRNFRESKIYKEFKNFNLIIENGPITNKKTKKILQGKDIFIAGSEEVTADIISKNNTLKGIIRFGTSLNNLDLNACKKKKIKVRKLPKNINSFSVARHALGFLLNITNNFTKFKNKITISNWDRTINMSPENTNLGKIGMGVIGKIFANYAFKLGFKINYFSRQKKNSLYRFKYFNSIDKLLQKSDVISLHLPLNVKTNNIINKDKQLLLKDKFLINTARGKLIDEKYLYYLLKKNYIKGVALDVFEHEPPKSYSLKLRKLQNVISTSHNSSYDEYTLEKMVRMTLKNIQKILY